MIGKSDLEEQVQLVKSTVSSIVISTQEELQNATNFIKDIKEKQKVVKDFYEPMVKATKESYDKIKFERDNLLNPLKEAEKGIRELMNQYNNKMLELKKLEEERIRKEQEEQKKKLEELQKDVAEGNIDNLENKMEEIMNATTLPEKQIEDTKVIGMGTRVTYKVEITNLEEVPATLNGVPLLELSKIGKDYLLQEYKIKKALKQEFKVNRY